MQVPPPPPPPPGQHEGSAERFSVAPHPPLVSSDQMQQPSPYEMLYNRQQPEIQHHANIKDVLAAGDQQMQHQFESEFPPQPPEQAHQQPVLQHTSPEATQQPDTQMSQEQFTTMSETEQKAYWQQWQEYEQYQQWQQQDQARQWEAYYAAQAQPQYQTYDQQQYSQQPYQQQQQAYQQPQQQQQVSVSSWSAAADGHQLVWKSVVMCCSGHHKLIHMLSTSSMRSQLSNSISLQW